MSEGHQVDAQCTCGDPSAKPVMTWQSPVVSGPLDPSPELRDTMGVTKCAEGCHYATHMQGGAPISVRICMLCKLIDFDDLTAQAVALTTPSSAVPFQLQGDGPCRDCGTGHNIRWFTDGTLWNQVLSYSAEPSRDDPGGVLCIPCFVARVDAAGLWPRSWRLLPEWHWETKDERAGRLQLPDVPR